MSQMPEIGNARLLGSDFDNTKFLTLQSEADPHILSVNQIYAFGIDQVLGRSFHNRFLAEGGHNNRAPAEIIEALVPEMTTEEVNEHTRKLVTAKLEILCSQIGSPLASGSTWPEPTPGFARFWEDLSNYNQSHDKPITTVDISAGHVPFIHQAYDHHGLERPDLVITDEWLVDELDLGDMPVKERTKPAPLPLEVAVSYWISNLNLAKEFDPNHYDSELRSRIIYTGDSDEKDGGLARNFGVDFVLLDPTDSVSNWQEIARRLKIGATVLETTV